MNSAPSSASHGRRHSLLCCCASPSQTAMAKASTRDGPRESPRGYSILVLLKAHVRKDGRKSSLRCNTWDHKKHAAKITFKP